MTNEKLEIKFPIKCYGRNEAREGVLREPVDAEVVVFQDSRLNLYIHTLVNCIYEKKGHRGMCSVSGTFVDCPYAANLPYTIDKFLREDQLRLD
jgi:hypothetical protein